MNQNASGASKSRSRYTIRGMMLVVLLIGMGLGVLLHLPGNPDPRAWRDKLLYLHALAIGFVIPLCTGLLYTVFAAPTIDQQRRNQRAGLAFASGCVLTAMAFGSLVFWVIVMAMVRD